jgi:hypothetical protein
MRRPCELGVALEARTSRGPATSSSGAGLHAAIARGLRAEVPLGGAASLEMTLDAGLASSVTAQVAHHDEASLGVWFTTATLGARFP